MLFTPIENPFAVFRASEYCPLCNKEVMSYNKHIQVEDCLKVILP